MDCNYNVTVAFSYFLTLAASFLWCGTGGGVYHCGARSNPADFG